MAYEVKLDVFQGPIDLLLQLITRQRVSIYDVSISTITEEYLVAVAQREDLDLESATGFLVVAATLLELKSARLLPARDVEDGDAALLEERDRLLARLVEASTFREAGQWVAAGLERGRLRFARAVTLEPAYAELAPDPLERVDVSALAAAAALALAPRPVAELDTSHVTPITASVKDAIVELSDTLAGAGSASFDVLCSGLKDRIEIVVRFLALLEMFKSGAIELAQEDRFGDIRATWTGQVGAQEVLAEAEEYALDAEAGSS